MSKGNGGKRHSAETREKAEKLFKKGVRLFEVAAELKLPIGAVAYWKKHPKVTGNGSIQKPAASTSDAITFLRHSRKSLNEAIRSGRVKQASRSELYMLLALDALEGG